MGNCGQSRSRNKRLAGNRHPAGGRPWVAGSTGLELSVKNNKENLSLMHTEPGASALMERRYPEENVQTQEYVS